MLLFCVCFYFSFILLQGTIPIIRCPANGAAEMVAQRLDELLREYLLNPDPSSSGEVSLGSFQRPVLILLDRNVDLSVMFQHPWTYQAMVSDMLHSQLNRVKVSAEASGSSISEGESEGPAVYDYDLDTPRDLCQLAGNQRIQELVQKKRH